jgi:hypothetical protein
MTITKTKPDVTKKHQNYDLDVDFFSIELQNDPRLCKIFPLRK